MSDPVRIACGHCGHLGHPKSSITGISYCCAECYSWNWVQVKPEELPVYEAAERLGGRAGVRALAQAELRKS